MELIETINNRMKIVEAQFNKQKKEIENAENFLITARPRLTTLSGAFNELKILKKFYDDAEIAKVKAEHEADAEAQEKLEVKEKAKAKKALKEAKKDE